MNYKQGGNQVWGTFIFGVVELKWGYKIHMKRNLIEEQLVDSLLTIMKNERVIGSITLTTIQELLRHVMLSLLRVVKSIGVVNHGKWTFKKFGLKLLHLILLLKLLFPLLYHYHMTF